MSAMSYVLVAEPDRGVAATLARIASAITKLPVRVATDGNDGHAMLASEGPPELLLTELTLPRRDGFSLIRGLRRADSTRKTRVLAFSAFPAMRRQAEVLRSELGPLDVLAKPIAPADVERLLRAPAAPSAPPPVGLSRPPTPPTVRRTPEPERLRRIEAMGIVDEAPPDATMQKFVADIARELDVPTALVTIVLESRQWFKSFHGLEGDLLAQRGTPRAWSFCQHVVEGRDALIVPDAREHPVFARNPMVERGEVVGYAGAPVVTPEGDVLGALCIVDTKPIRTSAGDLDRLRLAARRIAGELQLEAARRRRTQAGRSIAPVETTPHDRSVALRIVVGMIDALACPAVAFDEERNVIATNAPLASLLGARPHDLLGMTRAAFLVRVARLFAEPEEVIGRLAAPPRGAFVLSEDLALAEPEGAIVRWTSAPLEVPGGVVTFATLMPVPI